MRIGRKAARFVDTMAKGRDDLVVRTGGTIGGPGKGEGFGPAFTHVAPPSAPMPVLIAVPHAGRIYPPAVLEQMRDPQLSQLRLEDRYVDYLAVELAKATGVGLLVAHAPRAMLDLNRAHDDVDWDMIVGAKRGIRSGSSGSIAANRRARSGLGLVPRRLPGFGEIWQSQLSRAELDRRIEQIHRPYHDYLAAQLGQIRDEWGAALLVDLHSMPPLRPQNGEGRSPQIVLGDRFGASCHAGFIARAFQYLDERAIETAHNRPYSGGYVLDRHASPLRGLHAIQIEVCRTAYLDKRLAQPTAGAKQLTALLAGLVRELGAEAAQRGADGELAQAAE
ncbi:MAG: N-formylglutamate amidohydrolase [Pseudomonadota bacterium]